MKNLNREGLAWHTYFNREHGLAAVKLLPGEYFVTCVDMLLTTVLGSCVAACLRDPIAGVGGMNHFMLPAGVAVDSTEPMRYGAYAMGELIAALVASGARRERLEAKVFGGATLFGNAPMKRLGAANAAFVRADLAARGIPVVANDLGGRDPRSLRYYPSSGLALVKRYPCDGSFLLAREQAQAGMLAQAGAIAAQRQAEAGGGW